MTAVRCIAPASSPSSRWLINFAGFLTVFSVKTFLPDISQMDANPLKLDGMIAHRPRQGSKLAE
jgi:hypothetical protein